jgi:hypothetical protein
MSDPDPVQSIAINPLAAKCCDQMEQYKARKESSSAYCLELFRRALHGSADKDIAWQHLLEGCVGNQVRSAFYRHPSRYRALAYQAEQFYLVEAFARFWRMNEGRSLRLDSLAGLFALLHRCLHSALLEEIRIQTPPGARGRKPQSDDTQSLEDTRHWPSSTPSYVEPATDSDVDESLRARECAREIWGCAKSDRERRLLGLRWLGYTPLQIVGRWSEQYPSTREVGQMLQNILARYHRRMRKQQQEDDEI